MARPISIADPEHAWKFGVFGWPVAHSRSPAMQNAALERLGKGHWNYQKLPVPPELINDSLRALASAGFAGANVTIPHKEAALAAADQATDTAIAIGAANTLTVLDDGTVEADNTDAGGLISAYGADLGGKHAVVLGAGGSARACIWALANAGCATVSIWNRTGSKAHTLAEEFGATAVQSVPAADLLVNCTAVGLSDPNSTFTELPIDASALECFETVVDLVYRPEGTVLTQAATKAGCRTVDGIEILVAQGALSLQRWTGQAPPTEVMDEAARGSTG